MDIQQLCAALQGALSPEQHQRKAAEGLLEQVGPSDPWRHAARCASDAHASPPLGASSERNVSPGTEEREHSSRQRACLRSWGHASHRFALSGHDRGRTIPTSMRAFPATSSTCCAWPWSPVWTWVFATSRRSRSKTLSSGGGTPTRMVGGARRRPPAGGRAGAGDRLTGTPRRGLGQQSQGCIRRSRLDRGTQPQGDCCTARCNPRLHTRHASSRCSGTGALLRKAASHCARVRLLRLFAGKHTPLSEEDKHVVRSHMLEALLRCGEEGRGGKVLAAPEGGMLCGSAVCDQASRCHSESCNVGGHAARCRNAPLWEQCLQQLQLSPCPFVALQVPPPDPVTGGGGVQDAGVL